MLTPRLNDPFGPGVEDGVFIQACVPHTSARAHTHVHARIDTHTPIHAHRVIPKDVDTAEHAAVLEAGSDTVANSTSTALTALPAPASDSLSTTSYWQYRLSPSTLVLALKPKSREMLAVVGAYHTISQIIQGNTRDRLTRACDVLEDWLTKSTSLSFRVIYTHMNPETIRIPKNPGDQHV